MSSYRNLVYRLYIGIYATLPSKKAILGEPRLMRFKFVLFFLFVFFSQTEQTWPLLLRLCPIRSECINKLNNA